MPFSAESQRVHTSSIERVLFAEAVGDERLEAWTVRARWSRNAQLVLWLGLGVELGYFDGTIGREILKKVAETSGANSFNWQVVRWRERMPALLLERFDQLLREGFRRPSYRVPLVPSDESLLILRDGLTAALRVAQVPGSVMTFLERMMFADDWDDNEGRFASAQLEKSPMYGDSLPRVAQDALRYFKDLTNILTAARASGGDTDTSWFAIDLGLPFQTHINLTDNYVYTRAFGVARALVDATEREATRLILESNYSEAERTDAVARLSRLKDDWRKEASDIVESLNVAMPSLGTTAI